MENLNEEIDRIKKLMLFESSEVKDDVETDTEETEDNTKYVDPGDKNFMVYHDAFHYFEQQFGLTNIGAITVNPHLNISILS